MQTSYAYHLQVNQRAVLSMGVQAGVENKRSDYASLVGAGSNDPKLQNPFISHTMFNFGMGFYYRTPKFHAGFSVPELVPSKVSVNDSVRIQLSKANYFLFTRYRVKLNGTIDLEPGLLLKYTAGLPLSFDLNINMIFHQVLTMGLSYRRSESLDFLLKGQISPQLQFGYSYDYPLGEIRRLSSGSHELMVNYLFKYVRNNVSSPR
jgi:type IX secretion system PorP/SprF family membrane protein